MIRRPILWSGPSHPGASIDKPLRTPPGPRTARVVPEPRLWWLGPPHTRLSHNLLGPGSARVVPGIGAPVYLV